MITFNRPTHFVTAMIKNTILCILSLYAVSGTIYAVNDEIKREALLAEINDSMGKNEYDTAIKIINRAEKNFSNAQLLKSIWLIKAQILFDKTGNVLKGFEFIHQIKIYPKFI